MKILQIINSLSPGGAEKLVLDTSLLFREKGNKVDILLLRSKSTPFYDKALEENLKVITIKSNLSIYNPLYIFKLKKYLKGYDVIHVHLFPAFYWLAFAKMFFRLKTPIVYTEHNTTNRRRTNPILSFLDKIVYKVYSRIITISDSVDDSLRKYLVHEASNISKVYNGVNLKSINDALPYSKEELGYQADSILLIQVASFYKQKDQSTLMKALKKLPEEYKLLLVGQGPLENELRALRKSLELDNRVNFLGVRGDVPRLLKSVDIVVLSSHFEGLSLASIEGLGSGKPFVCSRAPGLTEVVDGAGVLFEIGNVDMLVNKLLEIHSNGDLYEQTVQKCLARAKMYDMNVMVDAYLAIYRELIK